ncbi:uncharacterized protein LOC112562948 isoform X2 [Pomacea canaliculata]|uniref:uncharacterized protein LOC112562948 isoform X2 n=1 Tax=Pomacea canaliculata TaxID=400727 RepID=UPI000D72E708|nr:uncharacterized protein LOC112562948 isoform X2 [Pomacea canaliculata]
MASTELTFWLESIRQWYPDVLNNCYFVPPLHFCHESLAVSTVCGQQAVVHVPVSDDDPNHRVQNPQTALPQPGPSHTPQTRWRPTACCVWSDTAAHFNHRVTQVCDANLRDDVAHQRVLSGLRALADDQHEVMMVISQLRFENYLNKLCKEKLSPSASPYPRANSLQDTRLHKGEVDILILHRRHGLVVGEVKSVGANWTQLPCSERDKSRSLGTRVAKAVFQLNRTETVLRHFVSDMAADLRIKKILFLPNVTQEVMLKFLKEGGHTQVAKALMECMGVSTIEEAVDACVLAKQLPTSSQPWQCTAATRCELQRWWSRFCGPATTIEVHTVLKPRVEVRTMGGGVAETGERLARLTLTPRQVDLLSRAPPLVYLTGPPGTGKTVVLVLAGLRWLREGHDVHVVSTWRESRVASYLIQQQLLRTLTAHGDVPQRPRVVRHGYNISSRQSLDEAVSHLSAMATDDRCLYVLADEAGPDLSNLFQDFCTKLLTTVPGLHLWAAAIRQGHRPTLLHLETLTHPLRCPPSVVREVQQAEEMQNNDVLQYADDVTLTSPTDGPTVTWLLHGGQQHGGAHPEYCEECGMATADYLRNKLNVGKSAQGADSPPPVSYRDVLILCPSARDDQETKVASPFIRGLRKKDLPVQVAGEDARDDVVRDVALAERDVVTVSHWRNVHGLERKVVVGMAADVSVYHRLQQMSRCTAQLVWICSGGRHCNHLHH